MKRSDRSFRPTIFWVLVGMFLMFGTTLQAANFDVTIGDDAGVGSLRQAILDANGTAGADTITINSVPAITLTSGELAITDSVIITGGGATVTRNGGLVFSIAAGANVSLTGLTIQGGGTITGDGGGISNAGVCYLNNTTVSGHSVTGNGGGIYNAATGYLNLENSTLSGNTAANGGGIYNTATGVIDILNSTISGNTATTQGGGLFNASTNTALGISIYNATITNNTAPATGGAGIASQAGMYLINTIVAGHPTGGNCSLLTPGILISGNNNLSDDPPPPAPAAGNTCNFTQSFDILNNTVPILGPLGNNGGPTSTHALLSGSPAINRGFQLGNITTDQRGVARAVQYDIGAYESTAAPFIDLSVFKAGPNVPQNLNSTFDFNVQVNNLTEGTTATGVVVTDTLDFKLTYVGFSASDPAISCTPNGQVITCTIPSIITFQTINISVTAQQGGAILNTASIFSSAQIDENPTNNSDSFTVEVLNVLPVITTLDPVSAKVQDPSFILTVDGSNFADLALVRWNGSNLVTTFVSSAQLKAEVPSGLTATAVAAEITVFNPEPGGGASNGIIFNVYNPQPLLTVINPTAALSGGNRSLVLYVIGSNFLDGAAVLWNGTPLATAFQHSGLLQAIVTPENLANPGTVAVAVGNPAPTIAVSNQISFLIAQGYHLFLPRVDKP